MVDFFYNAMIISGICFVFFMVVSGILGENPKYTTFCGVSLIGSFAIVVVSMVIIMGCMFYYSVIGPNYDKINSKIYEVQVIENTIRNNQQATNDDYRELIDAVNSYNETIEHYRHVYKSLNILSPDKLITYQKAIFDFETNTILWENFSESE